MALAIALAFLMQPYANALQSRKIGFLSDAVISENKTETPKLSEINNLQGKEPQNKEEYYKYFENLIYEYFDEKDWKIAKAIAWCESYYEPVQSYVINSKGEREDSWGAWQIHLPSHLEITKEQAMDLEWSTKWAGEEFRQGRQWQWSCFNKLSIL